MEKSIKRQLCFFMIDDAYISGYVDGEGCFCVSFQPSNRHRFGWEVRPSFSVSQNSDRAEVLFAMKTKFNCGSLRPDRSDKTIKFEVRSLEDLVFKVKPHFDAFPLFSSKQRDVELFFQICTLMQNGHHRIRSGFAEVISLAFKMNPSGKRKYSEARILSSLRADERIVYALGN